MFSVRGFEALFLCAGTLCCLVRLAPQLFLLVICMQMCNPPPLPATALPSPLAAASPAQVFQLLCCNKSSPPQLSVATLPTGQDECFFSNSFIVGLPYSLISCQFGVFFVFKFVVVLVLVVRGGTVYLPMPPSWLEVTVSGLKFKSLIHFNFF